MVETFELRNEENCLRGIERPKKSGGLVLNYCREKIIEAFGKWALHPTCCLSERELAEKLCVFKIDFENLEKTINYVCGALGYNPNNREIVMLFKFVENQVNFYYWDLIEQWVLVNNVILNHVIGDDVIVRHKGRNVIGCVLVAYEDTAQYMVQFCFAGEGVIGVIYDAEDVFVIG